VPPEDDQGYLSCGPPHYYDHPQGYKYVTNTNAANSLVDRTFQATDLHGSDVVKDGQPLLQRSIGDHHYNVPQGSDTTINRYFNGKDGHTKKGEEWVFTYPVVEHDTVPVLCPGDIIKVYTAHSIVAQEAPPQYFAQGVSHCLIQPIINHFTAKRDTNKQSADNLRKYNATIKMLYEYADKYKKRASQLQLFTPWSSRFQVLGSISTLRSNTLAPKRVRTNSCASKISTVVAAKTLSDSSTGA